VKKSLGLPDETAVIFLIDDDPTIRKYLEYILTKTYLTVLSLPSVEQAIVELERVTPSVILCDVNLGSGAMSGFTFYEKLLAGTYGDALKGIPFVMMSAMEDEFFIRSAKQMGIRAYLPKPVTRDAIETSVREALV
jgi:DNA-binding NarL/FixJ family response regulator